MFDAISVERTGVPAAAIITDRFATAAKAMAQAQGVPSYPFAVIEHPIANASQEDLRAKAEMAISQLIPLLASRSGSRKAEAQKD
jgi:hypothetical protein